MQWEAQNGPITKNGVLPSNFFVVEPLIIKSWFDVQTTRRSIFILFVSAGVSFEATGSGILI